MVCASNAPPLSWAASPSDSPLKQNPTCLQNVYCEVLLVFTLLSDNITQCHCLTMDPDEEDFLPDPKYTPISSPAKLMPKFNLPPPAKLSKKKAPPTKPLFKIPENKFLTKTGSLSVAKENDSNR